MEEIIAQRKFVLNAPPDRVWDLMGGAVIGSLHGLEAMHPLDESSFSAVLRVKMAFLTIPMHLNGHVLADEAHPESLAIELKANGWGGLIKLNQKVTLTVSPVDKDKSEVLCQSMAQDLMPLVRLFFLGRVKSMADTTLGDVEKRLQDIA